MHPPTYAHAQNTHLVSERERERERESEREIQTGRQRQRGEEKGDTHITQPKGDGERLSEKR